MSASSTSATGAVFSLTELLSSHDVLAQQEAQDRARLMVMESLSLDSTEFTPIKASLIQWASRGCPDVFPVYTVILNPPATCLDGVSRSLIEYVQYLLPEPLVTYVSAVNALLPGMKLTYSYTTTVLTINVSKDPSWTA